MLTPKQIHDIEYYHAGLLDQSQQESLERSWLADATLHKQVKLYFELLDGFRGLELEAFDLKLQTWEEKHRQKDALLNQQDKKVIPIQKSFLKRYRVAAAAVILVLLMPLGYYIALSSSEKGSVDQLFAANFTHYKAFSLTTRTAGKLPDSGYTESQRDEIANQVILSKGIAAYNEQNYEEAIEHLNEYLETATNEQNVNEVRFYLAVSQLATGDIANAKPSLAKLSKNSSSKSYRDAADWYHALTFLKAKESKKARKELRKIARKTDHKYQEKARSILPKLDNYIKE